METESYTEKLISIRVAAQRLDLSVRAVYRLIARGEIPRPIKVGGATRFFESDIANYFESLKSQRN
jgi:excisionase family DNA binding protein